MTDEHVRLFRNQPPRDIEVTVYGVTEETYERVTRRPGSYAAFRRGLDLLLTSGVKVRLKAMVLRSNLHELPAMARFCREHTKDYFRFDSLLHLRFDGDSLRNEEIRAERLSPEEIAAVEQADEERAAILEEGCDKLPTAENTGQHDDRIFHHCGAGYGSFSVSYDGLFRLCSSLWQKDCLYDLRTGSLADAWSRFCPTDSRDALRKPGIPRKVRPLQTDRIVPLVSGPCPPGNRPAGCLVRLFLPGGPCPRGGG